MERQLDGEKVMIAACFLLGMIVGVRHGGSIVLGLIYSIGILPAALFTTEMLSSIMPKSRAGLIIAALAVFGCYKAATGPVVHSGSDLCIDADRWGREKCL